MKINWPWSTPQKREAGHGYTDALLRIIQAEASSALADSTTTAAVESSAGLVGRALSCAKVTGGPDWVRNVITPRTLELIGRSLITTGESMHLFTLQRDMKASLTPAADWDINGPSNPDDWTVFVTLASPDGVQSRFVPYSSVIHVTWAISAQRPYEGLSPVQRSILTAKMLAETERSLGDEAAGPITNILPVPEGKAEGATDRLALLREGLKEARGRASVVETTAGAWGDGSSVAPRRDWMASRLGPMPEQSMVALRNEAFAHVAAACGVPPSLLSNISDGTAQRESLRRLHLTTIYPIAKQLENECRSKLDVDISLDFDLYSVDLVGRVNSLKGLIEAGVGIDEAMTLTGISG